MKKKLLKYFVSFSSASLLFFAFYFIIFYHEIVNENVVDVVVIKIGRIKEK